MKPHKDSSQDSVCFLKAKPGNDTVYLLLKQNVSVVVSHIQTRQSTLSYIMYLWKGLQAVLTDEFSFKLW
jgi:hypothetical protein